MEHRIIGKLTTFHFFLISFHKFSRFQPEKNHVKLHLKFLTATNRRILVSHLTNLGSKRIHQIFEKTHIFYFSSQTVKKINKLCSLPIYKFPYFFFFKKSVLSSRLMALQRR